MNYVQMSLQYSIAFGNHSEIGVLKPFGEAGGELF